MQANNTVIRYFGFIEDKPMQLSYVHKPVKNQDSYSTYSSVIRSKVKVYILDTGLPLGQKSRYIYSH